MNEHKSDGVLMGGLDGSNPLAFLAALGTLRILSKKAPEKSPRLLWEVTQGAWRPRISGFSQAPELLSILAQNLIRDRKNHPTAFVGTENAVAEFYTAVRHEIPLDLDDTYWFASLANDVHTNATSQLQLTRRDYFAGNLDVILKETTPRHLEKALFESWRYDDGLSGRSLHLLPTEDRRHAYQWYKPNGDPTRNTQGNMLGANRLAIEALPLFLGLPSSNPDRLRVTCWSGVRSDDSRWTWPIWQYPLSIDIVRSVLSLPQLQTDEVDSETLRAAGICAAFRCRRILVEQTPNLTPSLALW